jgi:RHS repeat-associated protein
MDENNDLIAFYVYDGVGLVAKVTPTNDYYYYHYDGLGSTVAITDSTAQIVNAYAYSPYGLLGAQETITNPFTYVGQYGVMAESHGLYFMRARYYDPEVGRFINKDPIGYEGGMNLYGYVGGNPVSWIDPWGLEVWIVVRKSTAWYLKPKMINGNHLYLWDTTTETGYGMTSSSGKEVGHKAEKEPPPGNYVVVPGSEGREEEVMRHMCDIADEGVWWLKRNDCFSKVEKVLKDCGLPADHPFKRRGPIPSENSTSGAPLGKELLL